MIDKSVFVWPKATKGAVSITYDDALPCHFDLVGPAWEAHGLRATFYTNIMSLRNNPEAWREMGTKGHELGNHSIFHPCRKNDSQRMQWLADAYDLRTYTAQRWKDEMSAASFALSLIDGKYERSFGNTCCNTEIGQGESSQSLEPLIEELFVAGRGPLNDQVVDVATVNYNALGHFSGDSKTFEALRQEIEAAVTAGGWLIYMIHGVGEGTHGLFIDPDEHQKLVDYLGEQQDLIWSAPLITVAQYLQSFDPDYEA
tara:strand:+ start:550 stop:1320 length:771 start_codon:yes stop_codon:yes gene_type:complete